MLSRLVIPVPAVLLLSILYIPTAGAQQRLENPSPGSFQSGLGVIAGWACDAQLIEVVFDGGLDAGRRLKAGTGTIREDTQGRCGDTDNGFGLLYNWNRLGDGVHTVRVYADGVEFAAVPFTVTTLGQEVQRGVSRTVTIPDFPDMGTDVVVEWQESLQNFALSHAAPTTRTGAPTVGAQQRQRLENPSPGSFQSGLGVIAGWACDAQLIEVVFDGGLDAGRRLKAGTGTIREDTQGRCGDTDNGFGLLYNWNRLGDGVHTVRVYADGVEFTAVPFTVTTLGQEVQRGVSRAVTIPDFPATGTDVVVEWQESLQNFALSHAAPTTRTVTVQPTLSLPPGVSSPNVEVSTLYSDTTVAVQASPAPSLLLATDADGTVLLALADMDGGLLGEGLGEVDVSIRSTAVTLAALAAGYRIPEIDQSIVDQITAHAQYPALLTALTQGLQADKNFLDRIMEDTETVRLIRLVAGVQTESAQPLAVQQHAASTPILPDGVVQTNFHSKSPWKAAAPWRWFGETALLPTPPFLAVSTEGTHATGNPNFVAYALELYSDGDFQDWYYVPGNGSLIDKGLNSGAALSGFDVPGSTPYSGPSVNRVRFARYHLSVGSGRAGALSFLNTANLLMTTAGVIVPTGALKKVFKKLDVKASHAALLSCGIDLATAVAPPSGTTASARTVLNWFGANVGSGFQALTACVKKPELGQAFRGDVRGLAKTLAGWGAEAGTKVAKWLTPIGWLLIAFEAANEVLPVFTSYVASGAGSVDYYLNWDMDGGAELVRVSTSKLPPAPTNLRVESSTGESVTLAWDGGQGSYRVYRWDSEETMGAADAATGRTHTVTRNIAQCYTVVSVDSRGMESRHSDHVCRESESLFHLPSGWPSIYLTQNAAVSYELPQATGGRPPYTYGMAADLGYKMYTTNSLNGLSLDPKTGVLSGAPFWTMRSTLSYFVTDADGVSDRTGILLQVDPDPSVKECDIVTRCVSAYHEWTERIAVSFRRWGDISERLGSQELCSGIAAGVGDWELDQCTGANCQDYIDALVRNWEAVKTCQSPFPSDFGVVRPGLTVYTDNYLAGYDSPEGWEGQRGDMLCISKWTDHHVGFVGIAGAIGRRGNWRGIRDAAEAQAREACTECDPLTEEWGRPLEAQRWSCDSRELYDFIQIP